MKITLSDNRQTEINVEVFGEGEPVLFLHGGPGCCHDSYASFFKPLSEHCQIIYFDQIACGSSDWSISGEYHIAHELEVIEAIRLQLGHKRLTVVGESWGTMLGLQYASHYPEQINHLILLSSVGSGLEQMRLFGERLSAKISDKDRTALQEIEARINHGEMKQQDGMAACQNIYNRYYLFNPANQAKIIQQPINFEQHHRVLERFDTELDFLTRPEQLRKVNIHMYQATHDLINPRDIDEILVSKLNPVTFKAVPECGHWIYLEQTDYINDEILRIVLSGH